MFCGNLTQNDICLAREVKHVWFLGVSLYVYIEIIDSFKVNLCIKLSGKHMNDLGIFQ